MKVLRIRLRNWRGVEDQEVKLAPVGLTIVQGPNETGKSSLVEALDLLFGELDSTTKHHVRAIKPVHRDEGAEVEADVETGAYAFTYAKRFHKRPSTTLTVRTPRSESRTGREAHERADAILRETLDMALWKALRVDQGTSLGRLDLKGQHWLSVALDSAAGASSSGATARSGEREENLFKRVQAERDRWWTLAGGERKELAQSGERVTKLEVEAQKLRDALAQLERDIERAMTLDGEERRLVGEIVELTKRRDDAEAKVRQLSGLRSEVERTHRLRAEAETALARARGDHEARVALVAQAKTADDEVAKAIAARDAEAPDYEQALAAHDAAARDLAATEETARRAAALRDLRAGDLERQRAALDHAQLSERLERIVQAAKDAVAAAAVVATNCCDDEHLGAIRSAHEAVVAARAKFEAASPAVRVTAAGACSPAIDGVATRLTTGDVRDLVVTDALRIELADLLTVEVRSGGGSAKPKTDLEKRQRELEAACKQAGVADLPAAVTANAVLADAKRALATRDRVVKENLRDLTRDRIEEKIAHCAARLAQADVRPADAPPPPTFDAAQDEDARAREAALQATSALETSRKRAEAARKRYDALRESVSRHESAISLRQTDSAAAQRRLVDAREKVPDDVLAERLAAAEAAHRDAAAKAKVAEDALAAAEPEVLESIAANMRKQLERAVADRDRNTAERHTLRGSLNERGDAGLSEKLGEVEARLSEARLDVARSQAQALAARTLSEAFDTERRAERSRYVAPFKREVESLGRIVFGPSLEVEIGAENLAIERRTLDGRALEYDQLSGGAREQLGVIGRLACAQLAAQQGGVPVVLDDAFGFADPDRLERMGALLARVAANCQVVLLTCDPARARNFPTAAVVRLG